jgi:hypothetical protein
MGKPPLPITSGFCDSHHCTYLPVGASLTHSAGQGSCKKRLRSLRKDRQCLEPIPIPCFSPRCHGPGRSLIRDRNRWLPWNTKAYQRSSVARRTLRLLHRAG